jgi:hypothetical protein
MGIKMKILKRHTIDVAQVILALLILQGCQKVIDIDLNEAEPKIVIEGMITDQPGPFTVLLSKSGSYFGQTYLPPVTGASVTITGNDGKNEILREAKPGIYVTSSIRGTAGVTYTLKVLADNTEYVASSTMPDHVRIDSLALRKEELTHIDFGGVDQDEEHVVLHCFFTDPAEKNFYRIRYLRDDTLRTDYYRLYDDQYSNGIRTDLRVTNAHAGHTYRVELFALNKATYGYYHSLEDLIYSNPVFGSAPANPDPVFTNGALGYFGACAVDSKSLKVTRTMINNVR